MELVDFQDKRERKENAAERSKIETDRSHRPIRSKIKQFAFLMHTQNTNTPILLSFAV